MAKLKSCLTIKNEFLDSQKHLNEVYKKLKQSQKFDDDKISTIYIKSEPDINLPYEQDNNPDNNPGNVSIIDVIL